MLIISHQPLVKSAAESGVRKANMKYHWKAVLRKIMLTEQFTKRIRALLVTVTYLTVSSSPTVGRQCIGASHKYLV